MQNCFEMVSFVWWKKTFVNDKFPFQTFVFSCGRWLELVPPVQVTSYSLQIHLTLCLVFIFSLYSYLLLTSIRTSSSNSRYPIILSKRCDIFVGVSAQAWKGTGRGDRRVKVELLSAKISPWSWRWFFVDTFFAWHLPAWNVWENLNTRKRFSGFAQKLREDRATSSRQRWCMVWMPDIIRILCSSYDPRYYDIIVKYHPDPSSHDNYCWTFRRGDNSESEHAHPIDGPHLGDWHGATFHWTLSQRL